MPPRRGRGGRGRGGRGRGRGARGGIAPNAAPQAAPPQAPARRPPIRTEVNADVAAGLYGAEPISNKQQRAWMEASKGWENLAPGNVWKAKRVLGAGSNGICGLWNYTGPPSVPPAIPIPRHVVVKQARGADYELKVESTLMKRIMDSSRPRGTNHIVKLYKEYYTAHGTGTAPLVDPSPYDERNRYNPGMILSRIYLEYCTGGDLNKKIGSLTPGQLWREEELWRLLECLAKACLVLESGREDNAAPRWGWPIAHFDIKPSNILIGDRDIGQHQRLPVFKLADFGLSLIVPPNAADADWIRQAEWRGTNGHIAPEQMYTWHPQRRIGAPTNIWAVGNMMHLIMVHCGRVNDDEGLQAFDVDAHDGLTHYVSNLFYAFTPTVATGVFNKISSLTFGHELLEGQCVRTYSKHLIQLVLSCLSLNPSDRPTARVIIDHAAPVLRYFDTINTGPNGVIDPTDLGDGGVSALSNSLSKYTSAERGRFQDDPQTVLPDGVWKRPDPRDWPIRPPRVGAPRHPVYFPEAVTTGRFRRRPERYVG